MTALAILHIILATFLVIFVLLQDSKGGGMGTSFGGGSSNSFLGATQGASLLTKLTRYTVIGFAFTALALTNMTSRKNKSVLDQAPVATGQTTTAPQNVPQNAPATNIPSTPETK